MEGIVVPPAGRARAAPVLVPVGPEALEHGRRQPQRALSENTIDQQIECFQLLGLGYVHKRITPISYMIAVHVLTTDVLHSRGQRPGIFIHELSVRVGGLDEWGVVLQNVLRNLRQ